MLAHPSAGSPPCLIYHRLLSGAGDEGIVAGWNVKGKPLLHSCPSYLYFLISYTCREDHRYSAVSYKKLWPGGRTGQVSKYKKLPSQVLIVTTSLFLSLSFSLFFKFTVELYPCSQFLRKILVQRCRCMHLHVNLLILFLAYIVIYSAVAHETEQCCL